MIGNAADEPARSTECCSNTAPRPTSSTVRNENRVGQIGSGSNVVPVFGTGTLGYVPPHSRPQEFLGASGFLLASVDLRARDPRTNRAPVTATLTPDIAQLALNATDGTLLRRSQVALFQAVARRPLGGSGLIEGSLRARSIRAYPRDVHGT